MTNIVDIHMHVLPGIDDGAKHMEESITMLKQSAAQGVGTIVVTPHSWAIDSRGIDLVHARFGELKQTASEKQIPIDLHLGCEMLVYPDTVDGCTQKLKDGRYPTMAGSNYVLTEFEPYFSQHDMEFCIEKISSAGYLPIIAHAERYEHSTVSGVKALKALGAKIQINAYSIVNEPKANTRETANALLAEKLVDFIGSDAHRLDHRPPVIRDGIDALPARYSKDYICKILIENPREILGMDNVLFALTWEDKDVFAYRPFDFPVLEDEFDALWFRFGVWTPHGSAGDFFRCSPISEEEAMRRTSGVQPNFSKKSFQS